MIATKPSVSRFDFFRVTSSGWLNRVVRPHNMTDLKQHAKAKSEEFTRQVTSGPRWKLEDELMCQVFGFTLYGYVFGIGRVHCFMDVEDIHSIIVDQLAGLGIGRKYVEGLVEAAHQEFVTENNQSWQNQLIGVGHSHALQEEMRSLVDSIFTNTEAIRKVTAQATAARPWWKFWSR